jgi:hypothetical protein
MVSSRLLQSFQRYVIRELTIWNALQFCKEADPGTISCNFLGLSTLQSFVLIEMTILFGSSLIHIWAETHVYSNKCFSIFSVFP